MYTVIFTDTEVSPKTNTVRDYGAAVDAKTQLHTNSREQYRNFLIRNSTGSKRFVCGHNIVHHDAKYIRQELQDAHIDALIDTL